MWWIIAAAILALVVVIMIIMWIKGSGDKVFDDLDEKIDEFGDCDDDGTADVFDKCPCDSTVQGELPKGTTKENCKQCTDTDCVN